MKKIFIIFLVFIFCGYSFHSLLPSYIKRIEIRDVKNLSPRPDLDGYLIQELNREFIKKGYKITAENGDLSIRITINRFVKDPHYYDSHQNVYRWRIEIGCNVVCMDEVKGKELWRGAVAGSSVFDNIDEEEENIHRSIEEITRIIVERTLTSW